MPIGHKLLLTLLCLAACSQAGAASLFDEQSVIDVELIGPVHELITNRENPREAPFVLHSGGQNLEVDVRVRGKSRLRVCTFPPLRLNFKRSEAAPGTFEGQRALKLVTHCLNTDSGERNVLEEYLAYRIFGLLSDVAFRVRLLHLTYRDTDDRLDPDARLRYGFVIEPPAQLAERVAGTQLHLPGVVLRKLESGQAALVYVFQYLIGNTDWSFVAAEGEEDCCHNGNLLEIGSDIYYVPYDFDLAGIVNASYAKPDPSLHLRSVKVRRYRGFCTDRDVLSGAIQLVKSRQDDIFQLVRDTPGLTEKDREQTLDYLGGFFKKAGSEEKLLKSFERLCKEG